MTHINPYLSFNGNCREAMTFYKKVLGGELVLQTIGDSPMCEQMPDVMKENVLHSSLTSGNVVIMGSDMVAENGLSRGNGVSLMLNCSSEDEIRKLYSNLAEGGTASYPVQDTFWGALFGDLTDKFGIHWLLNYSRAIEN